MTSMTSLARPLDLSRPSNRLPLLATVVFLAVGTGTTLAMSEATVGAAVWDGAHYGLGAFLVWALGRELDPDRPRAARYGVFTYVALVWLGRPAVLATVATLTAARIVLRPVGFEPTRVDLVGAVVVAGWAAAVHPVGVVAALAVAAALLADGRLAGDARSEQMAAGAVAAGAGLVLAAVQGTLLAAWELPTVPGLLAVLLAAAAATRILGPAEVHSTADATRQRLSERRLRWTRTLVVLTAALTVVWAGGGGVAGVAPVLAAIIGAGVTGVRAAAGRRGPGRAAGGHAAARDRGI